MSTVSGNTVSGNSPQIPSAGVETVNNTYTFDDTAVCGLLNDLLLEEKRQNEILIQFNETVSAYIQNLEESGILDSLQDQILVTDIEDSSKETEDKGSLYRDDLLLSLAGFQETLDSINKTVSGNNAVLNNLDGTTTAFQETYTEQAEAGKDIEGYKLSTGFSILFVLSVLAGIILSMVAWRKMR